MGEVIRFPDEAGGLRGDRLADGNGESATVIILPVIRIERDPDETNGTPHSGNGPGRRRRSRLAR